MMPPMKSQIFQKLVLPKRKNRPFFYTSFVSTIDGKVFVKKPGYWPIGSETDYNYFTFLRAHADIIIDGKNTALQFAQNTIETIHSKRFIRYRKQLNKTNDMRYFVMTSSADEALQETLKNPYGFVPEIFHSRDIQKFVGYLSSERVQHVFLDGGPKLVAAFLQENLIDEILLTIAPKIVGTEFGTTLSMIEGILFPLEDIRKWKLVSTHQVKDELFLRYRVL